MPSGRMLPVLVVLPSSYETSSSFDRLLRLSALLPIVFVALPLIVPLVCQVFPSLLFSHHGLDSFSRRQLEGGSQIPVAF